jgi:hypothetical protein
MQTEPKYTIFTNLPGCMGEGHIDCDSLQAARWVVAETIEEYCGDGERTYDRWEAIYKLRASTFTVTMPITVGVFCRRDAIHDLGVALNIVRNW